MQDHLSIIESHLDRINTGLGPVDSICATTDDQEDGQVRVYDDNADAVCDAAKLADALALISAGDWEGAWTAIAKAEIKR